MDNLQQQIEKERVVIVELDSKLNATPDAKGRLQMALNFVNDLTTAFGGDTSKPEWQKLARFNLQRATEIRREVQAATRNGADGITEP